mgnify:CR=1 FL=1
MVLLRSASHGSRNKLRLMSGPCVPIRVWGNVRNHTKDCKLSRTTFANSIDVGNASVAQHTNTNVVFSGGTRHGLIHFALFDRRDHLDVATWSVASGHLGGAGVDRRSLTWGARARTRKGITIIDLSDTIADRFLGISSDTIAGRFVGLCSDTVADRNRQRPRRWAYTTLRTNRSNVLCYVVPPRFVAIFSNREVLVVEPHLFGKVSTVRVTCNFISLCFV